MAREFSGYTPVGSSNRNFDPTEPVKQATFHLRHHTDLFETELLLFDDENEVEIGRKWPRDSFEAAVLILVKKVRDNLFHGRKMDLEEDKYQRNNFPGNLLQRDLANPDAIGKSAWAKKLYH